MEIVNLYFLCITDEEKGFFQGSERKEAFLDQKTSAQKTINICIFLKRLVHGFCQKIEVF